MRTLTDFLKNPHGATAIEYALLAGMIALAIVAVLPLVGTTLSDKFQAVVNSFQ